MFLHGDSEDSGHTGRMPRLIFAGRTLILLVVSNDEESKYQMMKNPNITYYLNIFDYGVC